MKVVAAFYLDNKSIPVAPVPTFQNLGMHVTGIRIDQSTLTKTIAYPLYDDR